MNQAQAVLELRKNLQKARKQYRHNNDTSPSLFNPEKGFAYAHEEKLVEAALKQFEEDLGSEYQLQANHLFPRFVVNMVF